MKTKNAQTESYKRCIANLVRECRNDKDLCKDRRFHRDIIKDARNRC